MITDVIAPSTEFRRMRRAPGLYIDAIGRAPAGRVENGVPVFIGFGQASRVDERITSAHPRDHLEFQSWDARAFDRTVKPAEGSFLREAVRGFFANGGRRCLVLAIGPGDDAISRAAEMLRALRPGGSLDDLDDVDLVCAPDCVSTSLLPDDDCRLELQVAILEHCRANGDRFAILDAPQLGASVDPVEALSELPAGMHSVYGAIYFPWIFPDVGADARPSAAQWRCIDNGAGKRAQHPGGPLPPCGHVAGLYARLDQRFKSARSPAGHPLYDVLDLDNRLSRWQHAALNEAHVNCITAQSGHGIQVTGARTLSGHDARAYIAPVRVVIEFKRWVGRNMTDLAFEPQNPLLWDHIRRRLVGHCMDSWRAGALAGSDMSEAFSVQCDAASNPPESLERGVVIANVLLAPSVPAEFIEVQVVHAASGISVNGP
jgi:hypothetical protein